MPAIVCALLIGLFVALPLTVSADVLELTTGERVEGESARAGGDHVTITVSGRTLIFQRQQVRAIYFGTVPLPCPR